MRAARELAKNNVYEKVRAEIAFAGYDMRCGDSADTFLRVTNFLVSFRESPVLLLCEIGSLREMTQRWAKWNAAKSRRCVAFGENIPLPLTLGYFHRGHFDPHLGTPNVEEDTHTHKGKLVCHTSLKVRHALEKKKSAQTAHSLPIDTREKKSDFEIEFARYLTARGGQRLFFVPRAFSVVGIRRAYVFAFLHSAPEKNMTHRRRCNNCFESERTRVCECVCLKKKVSPLSSLPYREHTFDFWLL